MEVLYENIAHYTHGMATMFFVFISILLYQKRMQNSLVRFLCRVMMFWAVIFLKDVVYLADGLWTSARVIRITSSIDMLCIPVFAVFLFEVVKPGWTTSTKVLLMLLPTIIPVGIIIFTDSVDIFRGLILYSNILAVVIAALLLRSTGNFNRYIKENYSYTETISIYWLRKVVFFLLLLLLAWSVVAWTNLMLGESVYYLFTIAFFTYIYRHTMSHHVISVPDTLNPFMHDDYGNEVQATATEKVRFAAKLVKTMEEEHMFLNPLLTLREVATATGTNRTYLSEYLNRELKTNFYDYVNSYRIHEAEKLLLSDKSVKLEEVSVRCGFNSLSTFQRSFQKVNGKTPARFRAEDASKTVVFTN